MELRGVFVLELGRSGAKRNLRTNKMKLSQVQEATLDLAMDWQCWGGKEYCHRNRVALPVGTNDTLGTC